MNLKNELAKPDLKREDFFSLYAKAVEERFAPSRIDLCTPDKLQIETGDGRTLTAHLENLWRQCRDSSEPRIDVFERHLHALASIIEPPQQSPAGTENVVPILKDDQFFAMFAVDSPIVREHLAGDIWVAYALDLPHATQTLSLQKWRKWDAAKMGCGAWH